MTSIQERLQLKREPLDKWSIREQLCLASAVCRSGDQNWMSVSRALKPFGEPNRPSDWFHQKNCAAQYGMLLGNVETPKRKNKKSVESGGETPAESILKRLIAERQAELKKLLTEEKSEYQKLQEDMILLQSGKVSEEQLDKWCHEIEEEENKKEQETMMQAQRLKERELRKQEIEKVWRPTKAVSGQKRKNSDPLDSLIEQEQMDEIALQQQHQHQAYPQTQELLKPALSPLLTSLLKSPSQVQSTPILHTAITNRSIPNTTSNPMIASLLSSSPTVTVSPGLQQLVSSAIGQESQEQVVQLPQQQTQQVPPPITNDLLDDPRFPNIKIDDLANSILVQDGPLPEIKKEEVDDIISEIIENAHDIVADPEQHLQLDGNGDININLGLDDFDDDDDDLQDMEQSKVEANEENKNDEKFVPPAPIVDPFEFQEDPVIHLEPSVKVSNINKQENKQYVPQYQQHNSYTESANILVKENENVQLKNKTQLDYNAEKEERGSLDLKELHLSQEYLPIDVPQEPVLKQEPTPIPGSVEIVEVVVTDDEEIDSKDTVKSDTVNSVEIEHLEEIKSVKIEMEDKCKTEIEDSPTESKDTASIVTTFEESSETSDSTVEVKKDVEQYVETKTDFADELFEEINMEVKFDKSGKAKRDYSRTKKKEEKGFHMLLSIEKAQLEDQELTEETLSDNNTTDIEKKDTKPKIKLETERSNSPWTEEEEGAKGSKRRYSTPVTPTDSIPNSPASSSTFYDDDREYRNWKKSVMLVYNRLATNKYASVFLKPINDDQAPGYSTTVYRPMDLLTLKKNIENGTIRSTLEFKRDTMLMFTNAIMYNRTNSLVYNMAVQMQQECIEPIEILIMAENHNNLSLRRETRTSELGTKRKRTLTDEILLKSTSKKRKDD